MINLNGKNVLCNTEDELKGIFEEANRQNFTWVTGRKISTEEKNQFNIYPVVLCFDSSLKLLSWNRLDDCNNEEYFITDLAKDLLNQKQDQNKEMTAYEFLNKYLEMTNGECGFCEDCKTIHYRSQEGAWCDTAYWTKDNIDQVYEIVKTGKKLKEKPEQVAVNNIRKYLDGEEQLNINSLKLAIKVLEERLNEEQK
ncbi:MAG TPA: hypothetical protein DCW90_10015 [Lachnospiraceae bacterium]|nr:hypothetical protein [Lachnospiraceae bacterium]